MPIPTLIYEAQSISVSYEMAFSSVVLASMIKTHKPGFYKTCQMHVFVCLSSENSIFCNVTAAMLVFSLAALSQIDGL